MSKLEKKYKALLNNTIGLYVIRFSTYFFALITIPYQTRIMGPEIFAKIGVASAIMVYFALLMDFGYILSATETVALNHKNRKLVSQVFTSVIINKIFLATIGLIILFTLINLSPNLQGDNLFFLVFFLATFAESLAPSFVYRGLQDMTPLALRSVTVKIITTAGLFIFLRKPSDYIVIPALILLGACIYFIWSIYDMKKRFEVTFTKVSFKQCAQIFKKSSTFFLSRIASTIYTTTTIIILNSITSSKSVVGNYSSADKLINIGKMGLAPIADSIYPYMATNKDFKLIKKILLYLEPVIIIFCLTVGIFAGDFCALLFGEEFREAGKILIALLPGAIFILPDYLLGFPTLSALGATKHANYSIYFTCVIHLINLGVLTTFHMLSATNLALLGSIAVIIETTYRFVACQVYIKRIN